MRTLVIVHIGERWPHYLKDCIHQARITNHIEDTEIVCLVNNVHAAEMETLAALYSIRPVYLETLTQSSIHKDLLTHLLDQIDVSFRKKYWLYVLERFFYLEEYMQQYDKFNVYMIETDNLVYVPLKFIEHTERLFCQGIALPFDSLQQGYPSFMFFRNLVSVTKLTNYVVESVQQKITNDMAILANYRTEFPEEVFSYPVLPNCCNTPLRDRKSVDGQKSAKACETAFLSDARFPFVVDSISYGQAIGGIDPCNSGGQNTIGLINWQSLFSIQETNFGWRKMHDSWIPFVNDLPLVNLHIHSKALHCFLSDLPAMPVASYNAKELEQTLQTELQTL